MGVAPKRIPGAAQESPKRALRGAQKGEYELTFRAVPPKMALVPPRGPEAPPRGPKKLPGSPQEAPKKPPKAAKMPPRALQEAPERHPKSPSYASQRLLTH